MVKIAFSSDNHLDINRLDVAAVVAHQASYLLREQVNIYVVAGDTFNHFEKTFNYVQDLQAALGDAVTVRFLLGNHDMVGLPYEAIESDLGPLYLHNKTLQLTDEVVLVGNNGWYDYGFVGQDYSRSEILGLKQLWYDRRLEQPVSDEERLARNIAQMRSQLTHIRDNKQQAIVVTHFVPRQDFIYRQPQQNRRLDMVNAFLGSPKIGELLDEMPVQATLSGHLHIRQKNLQIQQNVYYNIAVGYSKKHIHEWLTNDFFTEWENQLQILQF
jgi:putative phosphoesterase